MNRTYRYLSSLLLAVALGAPLAGCAVGARGYAPYGRDHYRSDRRDDRAYRRHERKRRKEQREYRKWRQDHADADRR